MLEMAQDMEEVAPGITFLNYVNPMAMNTRRLGSREDIPIVGLCHSVQGNAHYLSNLWASRTRKSTTSAPASTTWRST